MIKILNITSSQQKILGSYQKGDDVIIRCDCSGKDIVVTLPDARTTEDVMFWIKKIDSSTNTVTINTVSNQKIDGEKIVVLSSLWDSTGIYSTLSEYEKLNTKISNQIIIANSVNLLTGTSSDTVSDLQNENDGNNFAVTEVSGTPGFNLIVEFINVTAFSRIKAFVYYDGNTAHIVTERVYDYTNSVWISLDQIPHGITYRDHDISPSNTQNLIGKGVDLGRVSVAFYHDSGGTPAHKLYVGFCGLFK